MQRNTLYTVVIAAVLGAAVAVPVVAQSTNDRGAHAQSQRDGHGGQSNRKAHRGQHMEMLLETYDANGDGGVTQEEIDSVRAARLSEFDTDQDSQLNLEEYQALWLDAMRERMVDQFQRHDDDGDGVVTAEEFGQDLANIVDRRDRNDDGVLNADDGNARPQPPADTE